MSPASNASTPGWSLETSPYHAGEQLVQARAGARAFAERIGRQVIRDYLIDQHREFYASLPLIFVGTLDEQRRPWASVLTGTPGFVRALDSKRLVVSARAPAGDPVTRCLRAGTPIAMVGVQFETRRRNRVNGWITQATEDGFEMRVGQSFGNCPQYIQSRDPSFDAPSVACGGAGPDLEGPVLSSRACDMIRRADTFFIASASPQAGTSDPVEGMDVNHRGGRPGFVRVDVEGGRSAITWPDFVGNSAFNTLGNIALNPVAGLLFIDFETGDLLSVTGAACMSWDDADRSGLRGAERLVRLGVDSGVFMAAALPARWQNLKYAGELARTGTWIEAAASRKAATEDGRYRPFVVQRIEDESSSVRSFWLAPEEAGGLPAHRPGQFLPIAVEAGPDTTWLYRTYTITNQPSEGVYRVSIKRERRSDGTAGPVSDWFHTSAKVGSRIHARQPGGDFVLDAHSPRPVVLISAGIGITPMIAMVDALTSAHTDRPRTPDRPVWFLHFVRNSSEHAFGAHLRSLAARRPNLSTHFRYSDPLDADLPGIHFDSTGRIDAALLGQLPPFDDCDFYLCGPQAFMRLAYDMLLDLGARDERIRFESFGPASVVRRVAHPSSMPAVRPPVEHATIHFRRAGRLVEWTPSQGSILDAAEAAGLSLPSNCRSGNCGTCRVDVLAGAITYASTPTAHGGVDAALLCSALPASTELVFDA